MFLAAEAPGVGGAALRLTLSPVDLALLLIYFTFVLGIGFAVRRAVKSSLDFFLSGRSLPAWITGIGFISANLGAVELLGMSASGAQYGAAMVHYFWIGADRKSTRLNSSHANISYAVFCLKKKKYSSHESTT